MRVYLSEHGLYNSEMKHNKIKNEIDKQRNLSEVSLKLRRCIIKSEKASCFQ